MKLDKVQTFFVKNFFRIYVKVWATPRQGSVKNVRFGLREKENKENIVNSVRN